MKIKLAAALAGVLALLVGAASPVQASTAPAVNFWVSPIPILGGTLSDSSSTPSLAERYGWKIYDPDGVCSAYVQHYVSPPGSWATIWSFTGSSQTTNVTAKYQWASQVGAYEAMEADATDCV